uniref:Uncharacterized protein n=1 Tax=Rhizophora mucronata TaxID=61149 RepID=A0A2P2ML40_RHIMU
MCRSELVLAHRDCTSSLSVWMSSTKLVQKISSLISCHLLDTSGRSHCFNLLIPCFLHNL